MRGRRRRTPPRSSAVQCGDCTGAVEERVHLQRGCEEVEPVEKRVHQSIKQRDHQQDEHSVRNLLSLAMIQFE